MSSPESTKVHPFGTDETNPSGVVMTQPGSDTKFPMVNVPLAGGDGNWMPIPQGIPICPPGMEYLAMIDQLLVHQKVELLEVFLGCETKNKYTIKNNLGQTVYRVEEDTGCCNRNCLGRLRPFDMKITDYSGNEIIQIYRELRCDSCCCPCCLQRMEVMSSRGELLGTVVQEWSILRPNFRLDDANGQPVFRISGPLCTIACFNDVDFPVYASDGTEIGKITKQWSGLAREAFTDADHFGITFPLNLDVKMKALLLGALFLVDFVYFERNQ